MGWNPDALVVAIAFYGLWLASGVALVTLLRVGHGQRARVLAWACLGGQLLVAARAVQVGFAPLAAVSLVFAACGALALRRLGSAF